MLGFTSGCFVGVGEPRLGGVCSIWVCQNSRSPTRSVGIGVCFAGMFQGMFRGVFRGMFRCMFRAALGIPSQMLVALIMGLVGGSGSRFGFLQAQGPAKAVSTDMSEASG